MEPSKVFFLSVFSMAFLILYFILSCNNRLAADDYYFLKNANDYGIWNGMLEAYHSWVTRWFAILFLNLAFKSYSLFHSLFPYHLFTLVVFIIAVIGFMNILFKKFDVKFPSIILLLYSILFISAFFFFTFNIGETWFWVTSTTMYLWSLIFFLAGLTVIIQPGNQLWKKFFCFLCFLFIGGASESTAISILFLLLVWIIYIFFKSGFALEIFQKDARIKLLIIAIVAIVASLFISYMGEGRSLRQSALPHTGILTAKFISLKSFVKLLLFYLPLKIHWFLFFSIPWIYLGHQLNSEKKENIGKVFGKLIRFFSAFLLLSFISFIPVSYLLGETGPFRTWILISFYLAICSSVSGFYLGTKLKLNKKVLNRMFAVSSITLIVLMMIHINEQYQITSAYALSVDKRISYLKQEKEMKVSNTIMLDPLPSPGMLYSSEISEDSSHFSNQHIKSFFNLGFDIRKK
jgi:hypothetical protein